MHYMHCWRFNNSCYGKTLALFCIIILLLLVIQPSAALCVGEQIKNTIIKVQGIIQSKGSLNYNISVKEHGTHYLIYRISIIPSLLKGIEVCLEEHGMINKSLSSLYYFKLRNDIIGWGKLTSGNYVFKISNFNSENVTAFGYIVLFRVYDPRLLEEVDKNIYGIVRVPRSVGIVDYGVFLDRQGVIHCYNYTTNEVLGIIYINKFDVCTLILDVLNINMCKSCLNLVLMEKFMTY